MRVGVMGRLCLAIVVVGLALSGCGGSEESGDTQGESGGDGAAIPESTMTSEELANSGIHLYRTEVEVLECGQEPAPYVYDDKQYEVVITADQLTYNDLENDSAPLAWDRKGPNLFTKEAVSNVGARIAYTLTLEEWGMVYYYETDTVPCRRVIWTRVDG